MNLKTFFKFLSKNKLYTAINIFGFAISLMFVILIADYTTRQLSTDHFQENIDRITILGNEQYMGSAYKIAYDLPPRYPEIESICAYGSNQINIKIGENKSNEHVAFVDSTFFHVFSYELVKGDKDQALATLEGILVTESFANKTWGKDVDPMGQTVAFTGENDGQIRERTVTGVIKDFGNTFIPENTSIVMRAENFRRYNGSISKDSYGNAAGVLLFIMSKENADITLQKDDILSFFTEFFWPYQGGNKKEVSFTPMRDFHFSEKSVYIPVSRGNKSFVIILLSIGIIILFFAVINYINLTVAQSGLRAKEMATRRLLGAQKKEVVTRFISESILLCLIAFIIAFILSIIVEPYASDLLQSPISVIGSLSFVRALLYAAAILVLGAISGTIPATVISRYKAVDVVKGSFKLKSKMVFSKIFLVFQNIITISLIASTLTMSSQIKHMVNAPLGYNYKDILDVGVSGFRDIQNIYTFKKEVSKLACVEQVAFSESTPLHGGNNNTISYGKERMISFQILSGDTTFYNMMGFELIRDNHLNTVENSYFLNQEALRQLEIQEDSPSVKLGANYDWPLNIRGIYKDFQIRSQIGVAYAVILQKIDDYETYNTQQEDKQRLAYPWDILIKTTGDHQAAQDQVNEIFTRITEGEEMMSSYMEDDLYSSFQQERNMLSIVRIFTLIAILISALGLLAMSTFFIMQRRMEIGVRKVFGSTDAQILGMLVGTFLRSVLIAFVVSIPIIWYFMDKWLDSYVYKISLNPMLFIAAGIFALVVATLSVLWQSLKASHTNPSEAIRS